jgi:hypothetical protein
MVSLEDLAEPVADDSPTQALMELGANGALGSWVENGYMILPRAIPAAAIDAYCDQFEADAIRRARSQPHMSANQLAAAVGNELAAGYGVGTPYMRVAELRDVALHRNLTAVLDSIHGEPMGLHLNLTGWKSTRRGFHVDAYLNPPYVGPFYAATWIALDDVHADAGPFEFVPGSHRWPAPTQAKVLARMGEDGTDPDWPWRSEQLLSPLYEREIVNRRAHVERFLPHKGDVLVWSPYLVHRGSVPHDAELERRCLISHYSVVSRRLDMPHVAPWRTQHADGLYFVL